MGENSEVQVETTESGATEVRTRVSQDDFMAAWQEEAAGDSLQKVQAVADRLGLKKASVQQRATQYRKRGLPLDKMPRGGGATFKLDDAQKSLAAINARIAEAKAAKEAEAVAK